MFRYNRARTYHMPTVKHHILRERNCLQDCNDWATIKHADKLILLWMLRTVNTPVKLNKYLYITRVHNYIATEIEARPLTCMWVTASITNHGLSATVWEARLILLHSFRRTLSPWPHRSIGRLESIYHYPAARLVPPSRLLIKFAIMGVVKSKWKGLKEHIMSNIILCRLFSLTLDD